MEIPGYAICTASWAEFPGRVLRDHSLRREVGSGRRRKDTVAHNQWKQPHNHEAIPQAVIIAVQGVVVEELLLTIK